MLVISKNPLFWHSTSYFLRKKVYKIQTFIINESATTVKAKGDFRTLIFDFIELPYF